MKEKIVGVTETWRIDGEYIVGPENSPRFRVMGSAPYNQKWIRLASKAPELAEALKKIASDPYTTCGCAEIANKLLREIENGGDK